MRRLPWFACLFILILASGLTSCGICSKKVNCPAFSDTVLVSWFPYTDNQLLIFFSSQGQADTLLLKNTGNSQPYVSTSMYSNGCIAEKSFTSTEADSSGFLFSANLQSSTNSSNTVFRSASIDIKGVLISTQVEDTGFMSVAINALNASVQHLPAITLGNRTFSNVIVASLDTSSQKIPNIYKVYFSKGQGLVGYSEYLTATTWVRQ